MPQQIEVPGMGIVEFPDGMDDAQISAAIKANMPKRGTVDKLTGATGERYQTWPERAVRSIGSSIASAATLPGDVVQGKVDPTSEEGVARTTELATLGSPLGASARAGERIIPGVAKSPLVQPKTAPPTAEALKEAAQTGYKQAGDLGVDISASGVSSLGAKVATDLERDGINAKLAPKTFSIISEFSNPPPGAFFTIQNFDTLRKTLGNAAKDFGNPTEQLAASRVVSHLDDYLAKLPEADVVAGPASKAAKLLSDARGNYAAGARAERIDDKVYAAEQRSSAANSGANVGNSTRQRIADLLLRPKERRGFSPQEIEQAERVVGGTATGNTARVLGNLLGGGGGLGMAIGGGLGAAGGAAFGGPAGAAVGAATVPIVGALLKQGEAASVARQTRKLDEMVRRRSPLYESRPAQVDNKDLARKSALVRALLLEQQQ